MSIRWWHELNSDPFYRPLLERPDYALNRHGPVVGNHAATGLVQNDAWTALDPELKRLEVEVLRKLSVPRRADVKELIDESTSVIKDAIDKGKYDPSRPFAPWAKSVLRFHTIDSFRRLSITLGTTRNPSQLDQPSYAPVTRNDEPAEFIHPIRQLLMLAFRRMFDLYLLNRTDEFDRSASKGWVEQDIQTTRQWPQRGAAKQELFDAVFWTAYLYGILSQQLINELFERAGPTTRKDADHFRQHLLKRAQDNPDNDNPDDLGTLWMDEIATFIQLTAKQYKHSFRTECWRLFELRCAGWFLKSPSPGTEVWEHWAWMARKRYLDERGHCTETFPRTELAEIARGRWDRRVYVLTLFRMWLRVPKEIWQDWIKGDSFAHEPFPPPKFAPDTPTEAMKRQIVEWVPGMGERRLQACWDQQKRLFLELPTLYGLFEWDEDNEL